MKKPKYITFHYSKETKWLAIATVSRRSYHGTGPTKLDTIRDLRTSMLQIAEARVAIAEGWVTLEKSRLATVRDWLANPETQISMEGK